VNLLELLEVYQYHVRTADRIRGMDVLAEHDIPDDLYDAIIGCFDKQGYATRMILGPDETGPEGNFVFETKESAVYEAELVRRAKALGITGE
jgi:hypothetical protein